MELPVIWEMAKTQWPKYSDQNTATETRELKYSDWNTVTEMQISGCTNYQFE